MTAGCADSGSHLLHWSRLFHCSDSRVASQTDRLHLPRSHDRFEHSAGQAPKLKAAEAEAEAEIEAVAVAAAAVAVAVEAGNVEALASEPLDAGNVSQGYRRADRRAVVDDSRRATLSDVTSIVDEEAQE